MTTNDDEAATRLPTLTSNLVADFSVGLPWDGFYAFWGSSNVVERQRRRRSGGPTSASNVMRQSWYMLGRRRPGARVFAQGTAMKRSSESASPGA